MKIQIELTVYELDGKDINTDRPDFAIESHWNYDKLVIVHVGGHKYTLDGKNLIDAIRRAIGWRWG